MPKQKTLKRVTCSHDGCSLPPAWYTDPPLCRRHRGPLDEWYAGVKRRSGKRSNWAEGLALPHSMYLSESVARGPAHTFFHDYYRRRQGGRRVAFSLADMAYFCAAAAASGVVGNLAYDALKNLIARIRTPQREIIGGETAFEAIVEEQTYERIRKHLHGRARALDGSEELEEKITIKYKLMVTRKQR